MPKARIRIFGGATAQSARWMIYGRRRASCIWKHGFPAGCGGEENKARQQKEKISCQAEEEVGRLVRRLIETNPDRVIVCTEIGYGLVPVDAFDRAYRETVGRICTGLAGKAAAVDRIVCGIDTRIKEM